MPHFAFHVNAFTRIKKELKEIYATTVLRAFSLSLISVFIPIYLLEIGYSLNQALLYLAVFYIVITLFGPISVMISSKFGMKHTMAVGPVMTVAYLLLLRGVGDFNLSIYPIAIVGAIGSLLIWVPMNSHFAKATHKRRRGTELGVFKILQKSAAVAAPAVGGVMIAKLGFSPLFVLASVLLLISVAPLFLSYEYKNHMKYKWSQVFSKKNLHWINDFFVQGFILVPVAIMFPIYVYKISQQFSITGIAVSIMSLGIAVAAILIGRITDKFEKKAIMRVGGIMLAAVMLTLIFVTQPLIVYALSFFSGIGWAVITIPLFTFFCNSLKPGTRTEFMGFRDFCYGSGRFAALLLLVALPGIIQFQASFAMAAVASIYFAVAKV